LRFAVRSQFAIRAFAVQFAVLGLRFRFTVLEAGNWKLETGSWKLEAGSWKLEAGNW
jgi:hypothetical protein